MVQDKNINNIIEEDDKNSNKDTRNDYTDLRGIYKIKIISYIALAIFTIATSGSEFKKIIASAIVFLTGVIFDFFVMAKVNKGIRKKIVLVPLNIFAYGLLIILVGNIGFLVTMAMDYKINNYLIRGVTVINYAAVLASGIGSPVTDFCLNKPNDD